MLTVLFGNFIAADVAELTEVPSLIAADEVMALRGQNAKLRDQIATLVFQQCLSENPPRQNPSDAQQSSSPSVSASQILRADSGPNSAQSLARSPSANLAQSTLFRAPSGGSQTLTQLSQLSTAPGGNQARTSQLVSTQQQMAEERKRYGLAVSAKDDRIRELDDQLRALKQAQRAESISYKNRWVWSLSLVQVVGQSINQCINTSANEPTFCLSSYVAW